jgi:hypothetical protein
MQYPLLKSRLLPSALVEYLIHLNYIALVACTPSMQPKIESQLDPLELKIEEAIVAYKKEKAQKGEPNRDVDGTWLNVGIRYNYFILKKYVDIKLLEKVAGVSIYTKGPHKDGINFNSAEEFGHYNPEFLKKVKNALLAAMKREAFNKLAQKIYDTDLKNMARTYHRAYGYTTTLDGYKFGKPYDAEEFRTYADEEEKGGYDWYESVTAPGFWSRRVSDKTDKAFLEILEIVINKYDKGFIVE